MLSGFGASAGAALFALWSQAAGTRDGAPLALSANFVLQMGDDGGRTNDRMSGSLSVVPGGETCVMVKTPVTQEMRLTPRELVIYYPDRDLALVAAVSARQAPPMLDALLAGVVDPGSTLPSASRLIEERHADGRLYTRWRVVDDSGHEVGEMRATEARDGALSMDLLDSGGKPQRRFSFGDRVRVGTRSVPRAIVAEYFAAGGVRVRREQWSLQNLARLDAHRAGAAGCARLGPRTKVQSLPW
jgi:hypothetical protein